ncbi:hypothetical protein RN96_05485 [Fusobacterium polymorphum]|uniref:DUF2577 domain-containing protein n=1 Tax=Fusobacterium nucleatum subsp. polymorphum TaxID=76857 RepID=A0A2B7YNZ2_FUSNP|nr:DUF2577 family protein [Fusobacterium polymorphum]PGH22578.1 hypothetical protein RN96_05485 [Fusobacterium polymorphum]
MSENKKSWDIAVAEKFKERENPSPIGAVLGKILKPLPDISIELLNGYGVIDSDKIYLSNAITNRLAIECTIKEFESQGNKSTTCKINDLNTEGAGSDSGGDTNLSLSGHSGTYADSSSKKDNKDKGKFILQTVFHLKKGMFVLVIPNFEEDKFFIVDVFNYAPEVSLEWEYYQK